MRTVLFSAETKKPSQLFFHLLFLFVCNTVVLPSLHYQHVVVLADGDSAIAEYSFTVNNNGFPPEGSSDEEEEFSPDEDFISNWKDHPSSEEEEEELDDEDEDDTTTTTSPTVSPTMMPTSDNNNKRTIDAEKEEEDPNQDQIILVSDSNNNNGIAVSPPPPPSEEDFVETFNIPAAQEDLSLSSSSFNSAALGGSLVAILGAGLGILVLYYSRCKRTSSSSPSFVADNTNNPSDIDV